MRLHLNLKFWIYLMGIISRDGLSSPFLPCHAKGGICALNTMYYDNKVAIQLAKNKRFTNKSKHISRKYHYIRILVNEMSLHYGKQMVIVSRKKYNYLQQIRRGGVFLKITNSNNSSSYSK